MSELRFHRIVFVLLPLVLPLAIGLLGMGFLGMGDESYFFAPAFMPFALLIGLHACYLVFLIVSTWGIKFFSLGFRVAYIGLYNPLALAVALICYRLVSGRYVPNCMDWCGFLHFTARAFVEPLDSMSFVYGLIAYILMLNVAFFFFVCWKKGRDLP